MKRICAVLLIFILCFSLAACGGSSDGEFNSETNQKVEYKGVSFEVPESWEKPKEDKDYFALDTPYGALFSVQVEEIGQNKEGNFDKYEEFMKGNPTLVGEVTREDTMVDDVDAMKLEYVAKDDKGTYYITDISFENKDSYIMFTYLTDESDSGKSDFEKIINSIQL